MSDLAIETDGLTKFYGETRGIEDLDLRVERGEVFGFLGPNGAGKTTTIRLLLDLIRPTRGRAAVAGLDRRRDSVEVRRLTGYLPGELKLPDAQHARPASSTTSARLRGGVEPARDRASSPSASGSTSTAGSATSRRATSRRSASSPPSCTTRELLILDEPTSGLDPLRQQDVLDLVRERAAAGRTVFLSSHELDQVEHVAERVGIVRDGRLVAVETIAALKAARGPPGRGAPSPSRPPGSSGCADVPACATSRSTTASSGSTSRARWTRSSRSWRRCPVQTLTSEPPELDEIFLSYYGRAMRD